MNVLSRSLGTRPRLAVELRPEGVVAARAEQGSALLAAVAAVELGPGASLPQLRAGAIHTGHTPGAEPPHTPLPAAGRALLTTALRSALESVAGRARDTTLIVPDTASRVLLLDFDTLPGKAAEALSLVRFRLKKLVPFDADTAAVAYQVLSTARGAVRVLAVAIPSDLLAEYESLVREAGFEPGAVLPSTLAALAALPDSEEPALVVNASRQSVTTAISRGNSLLLHRTVDLGNARIPAPIPVALAVGDPIDAAARIQTSELERELSVEDQALQSGWELAQAVSVAAAYFEDTLERPAPELLVSGTLPAAVISDLLAGADVGPLRVANIVDRSALAPEAALADRSRIGSRIGWFAGVRGALAT